MVDLLLVWKYNVHILKNKERNVEYKVIEHYNLREFVELVNIALANGWSLAGGVSKAFSQGNSETWSQAMTRSV